MIYLSLNCIQISGYLISFKRGSDLRTLFSVSKSSYGQITRFQSGQIEFLSNLFSFERKKFRFTFFREIEFFSKMDPNSKNSLYNGLFWKIEENLNFF
ncbi:hypothetical protein LEP1GSC104_2124 [Leptospira interrogans str. UI 12621]|uniref:Uncharacterized protein n=1 Tax=Leptospira interrogans str. UI 12621 TaxID=1049937 RepID=A0A0F6H7B6_LEPIR|nr:hypothetical protein LEP1GSC104_2124 [Leptospira interrogans str. UI 12621]